MSRIFISEALDVTQIRSNCPSNPNEQPLLGDLAAADFQATLQSCFDQSLDQEALNLAAILETDMEKPKDKTVETAKLIKPARQTPGPPPTGWDKSEIPERPKPTKGEPIFASHMGLTAAPLVQEEIVTLDTPVPILPLAEPQLNAAPVSQVQIQVGESFLIWSEPDSEITVNGPREDLVSQLEHQPEDSDRPLLQEKPEPKSDPVDLDPAPVADPAAAAADLAKPIIQAPKAKNIHLRADKPDSPPKLGLESSRLEPKVLDSAATMPEMIEEVPRFEEVLPRVAKAMEPEILTAPEKTEPQASTARDMTFPASDWDQPEDLVKTLSTEKPAVYARPEFKWTLDARHGVPAPDMVEADLAAIQDLPRPVPAGPSSPDNRSKPSTIPLAAEEKQSRNEDIPGVQRIERDLPVAESMTVIPNEVRINEGVPKNDIESSQAKEDSSPQKIMDQIVSQCTFSKDQDHKEIRIQLKPEFLGKVNIRLEVDRGIITAEFVAESQVVKETIAASLAQLRYDLQESGLTLGQVSVNLNSQEQPEDNLQGRWKSPAKKVTAKHSEFAGFSWGSVRAEGPGINLRV